MKKLIIILRCVSYNCNSVRNNANILEDLLDTSNIVFLQELMLNKSDLGVLNDFHKDFRHTAYVKDRETEGINEGRPSGGVAIFWRCDLSLTVSPVIVDDSVIGIILINDSVSLFFLNVYLPCDFQTMDSLDKYRNALALLGNVIKEQNINNVVLVGDFNADPNKGRFWRELSVFSESLSLSCLDSKLPRDTFTYLCPAKSSTSWLDHILCTNQLFQCFSNVYVEYGDAICDHFPVNFELKLPIILKQGIKEFSN